jgi:hypothetical protein
VADSRGREASILPGSSARSIRAGTRGAWCLKAR